MIQSYFVKKLVVAGVASTLSAVSIIGTVLIPEIESTAQAATFTEIGFDTGELIPDSQGPVIIPTFDIIEGTLFNGGDIDLYQLQLSFDADVIVSSDEDLISSNQLFLFNQIGEGLGTALNELSFSGLEGEIFYLGINGTVALNETGETILDPSIPSFVGSGILTSWEDPGDVAQVVIPYQVSLRATPSGSSIPEPSTILGLFAVSGLGLSLNHKKQV